MEDGDLRYVWAAYRQGGLRDIDPIFKTSMSPDEFAKIFGEYIANLYNGPLFFMTGETATGVRPLGFAAMLQRGERVLEVGMLQWFPWAGNRAILEAAINFFNTLRRDYLVLEYAHQRDEAFFQKHLASRKILRRVGVVHGLYPDAPAILFQTRRWGDW